MQAFTEIINSYQKAAWKNIIIPQPASSLFLAKTRHLKFRLHFRPSNACGGFQLSPNHIMWWLEFQVLLWNLLPWKPWAASSWQHISVICICCSPVAWGVNDEIFMLVTIPFLFTKNLCYHPPKKELRNLPAAKCASAFVKSKKQMSLQSLSFNLNQVLWVGPR